MAVATPFLAAARQGHQPHRSQNLDIRPCAVYYLRDSEQIAPALSTELDKRLDPVATAVVVRIRLKPDVRLLRTYGSHRLTAEQASRVRAIEVAADQQAEKKDGIQRAMSEPLVLAMLLETAGRTHLHGPARRGH